jgi:hypothetical protein
LNASRSSGNTPSQHSGSRNEGMDQGNRAFSPASQAVSDCFDDGCRWTSRCIPIWWARQAHAVCALVRGHDVSGTAGQTLGRAMQSTTTMMPVWQCGHSRDDWSVPQIDRGSRRADRLPVQPAPSRAVCGTNSAPRSARAASRCRRWTARDGTDWATVRWCPKILACCICRLIRPNSIWSAWASVRRVGVGYGAAVGGGATGPFEIPLL